MIDSIVCSDNNLQTEIGLVRANNNNMCRGLEAAASTLIEVHPYKRAQKLPSGPGIQANISSFDFSGGRGSS